MSDNLLNFFSSTLGQIAFIFIFAFAYMVISVRVFKVLRRHPISFTVAVLGFPASGKTVYVTTLFDELLQGKSSHLKASPYGIDTTEEVFRNLKLLGKGEWLPRTVQGNVFFFRAIASMGGVSRVRLEIADFAGENFEELQPENERWLHRGDYFKYVIDADAIFLAADGARLLLLDQSSGEVEEMINAFVAGIQIVADARGAIGSVQLGVPVALLVMKADLMDEQEIKLIRARLSRFEAICRTRCRNFEIFFVSSTGPLTDKKPPALRTPYQVIEPLEWALRRATRISAISLLRKILFPPDTDDNGRWERRR